MDATNNRRRKCEEEKPASELNIRLGFFFFLSLLSLSSIVRPHLRSLYIVLDMKGVEGGLHISGRVHRFYANIMPL